MTEVHELSGMDASQQTHPDHETQSVRGLRPVLQMQSATVTAASYLVISDFIFFNKH